MSMKVRIILGVERKIIMKEILTASNFLFVLALTLERFPSKRAGADSFNYLIVILALEVFYIFCVVFISNKEKIQRISQVTAIILGQLILWEVITTKLDLVDSLLLPSPSIIFSLFITELPVLLKSFLVSLHLLFAGYALALILAVPFALVIGWRERVYKAVNPFTKVLAAVPSIIYIPYAIAVLPTFKAESIFIIFVGAFWPVFIHTLKGVFNVEKEIIDNTERLNSHSKFILFQIILHRTLPSIMSGAAIGLAFSFILLIAIEMTTKTSGLGCYVKCFSDFADYPRVMVGTIFIGIVVAAIIFILSTIQNYLRKLINEVY